jgi:hypothetical protein
MFDKSELEIRISEIVKRSPFIQSISRTSFPRTRPASP